MAENPHEFWDHTPPDRTVPPEEYWVPRGTPLPIWYRQSQIWFESMMVAKWCFGVEHPTYHYNMAQAIGWCSR